MVDLSQVSDEDLAPALFDALVERLDARALEDPSITVVNRMPTAFAVSRRGNLFTLSQGIGLRLLRGDLKWKDRHESPRTFHISRATIHPRLIITPDRIEGTPDEILDQVVSMFLGWTGAETGRAGTVPAPQSGIPEQASPESPQKPRPSPPEMPPAPRSPRQPSKVVGDVPPKQPTVIAPVPTDRITQAPMPSGDAARSVPVTLPKAADVPPIPPPVSRAVEKTSEAGTAGVPAGDIAPPPAAYGREPATRTLRTYQLLFETARRELEQARVLPVGSRYFLISAGVFVGLTAEAFFNDLGSRMIPSWSQLQRLDPREKAEVLNIELFNEKVDWSVRPFQSVVAALGFRRALAHAHTETLSITQVTGVKGAGDEVPRTRRTAWQEYCDVGTIQRWITDVGSVIDLFSRTHDAG